MAATLYCRKTCRLVAMRMPKRARAALLDEGREDECAPNCSLQPKIASEGLHAEQLRFLKCVLQSKTIFVASLPEKLAFFNQQEFHVGQ